MNLDNVTDRIQLRVETQARYQVWNQIRYQAWDQVWDQVWIQVGDQLWFIHDKLDDELNNLVSHRTS